MERLQATRRGLLGAALAAGALPARAATTVPEAATLMAPGPERGAAASFAASAARGLALGLVQAAALRVTVLGGPDGVTAANRFAASTPPDGRALLVLPGLAAQALLVGDSRARFDPRLWPAVTGSLVPAMVAGRGPLRAGAAPRFALPGPAAPDAAGLLALDLLGRVGTPVFLNAGVTPQAAVAAGAADACVLAGPQAMAEAAALGLLPWFAFEPPGGARAPELAEVPTIAELLPDPANPRVLAGLRAAGMALGARGLLVLPALTSADSVALWRQAARRWAEEEQAGEARQASVGAATQALASLCPGPEATLAYRDWLRRRLAWQAA